MKFQPGDHVVDSIDDALHGLLSLQEKSYVESHCTTCPICAVAMAEARKRLAALKSVPHCEASELLIQSTLQQVHRRHDTKTRRRSWFWRITGPAMAAMVVILATLHLYYATLTPSTYDLRVMGQNLLIPGSVASIRTQLLNSGKPVLGSTIDIALEDTKGNRTLALASFKTNAQGTGAPQFQIPDWVDGTYTLRVTARSGWDTQRVTQAITLQRAWRLMLSSDKPIYQPGQTIHLRALALRRPDLKPVAGQEAVFSLTDPNGNMIFKQTGVTSRYGLASADCPLATEILHGAYTAVCRIGQTESRQTLEVKPYVLPKFKTDLSLDRPFYQPGQNVLLSVKTHYFFGKPVVGAKVEVEAFTTDATDLRLATLSASSDATGSANIHFKLPGTLIGSPGNSGDARILLTAKVRDSAGQEQTASRFVVVTTSPIHVEVIPEAGQLVPGIPNRIYVLTTYADGRPAQTQLAISGLTSPPTTSPLGVAMFELTPSTEAATMVVQATDSQGITSRKTVELKCGTLDENFLVRTDKVVYRGGEALQLETLGGGREPIFIDLIKDGQTMLTQTMEVIRGKGGLTLDLPPELSGTLELVAYRYSAEGLPIRKTRILYVEPANQLQVQTTLDQAEYRPGHTAKLAFQVTDAHGKPVPGALSLAAVDEAVYAVLDQKPGMEQTFFNLEQKLLEPVYAIYPWSPEVDAVGDRQLLNQALFAKAADWPGDRDALFQRLMREGLLTPRMLKSLNTPNGQRALQEQLSGFDLSEEQKAMLLNEGVHSLSYTTGPENTERATRMKRSRLEIFPLLWILAGFLIVFLLAFGLRGVGGIFKLLLVLFLLGCLVSIMLPSLGRARMSTDRAIAAANVSGILKAMVVSNADLASPSANSTAPSPRVRKYFPETLLWRPELITDDLGRATLDLDLADSITTWRLSASAVSAQGELGATTIPIRVFQPFFVDINAPANLTRNDEIALPVVVYNYLDKPQTVVLSLDTPSSGPAAWFELLDEPQKTITLKPSEVRSLTFRIRVRKIGLHDFQITARAGDMADAIKRSIEVSSDGQLVEKVSSGTLAAPTELELTVPPEAIPGSVKATLKLYPSAFSQLVEGLDGVFQQPYGCFEQTSSTTYPNVLALTYLKQTGKALPQVEAKARQYIHLGYQRLLSFEIPGGGFDWFGRPPANRTLTAYGLMEFQDMAQVHNVDPGLIQRTSKWLLEQRNADGSWPVETHRFYHDDPTGVSEHPQLATTAYIAWAVFNEGQNPDNATQTHNWLVSNVNTAKANPYTLALVANALLAMNPRDPEARTITNLLDASKQTSADGKSCWWAQPEGSHTAFYGKGISGEVETTALVTLALLGTGQSPATSRAALNWLIAQKDPQGTWHSTQATVWALKALLAASGQPLGGPQARQIALNLGNQVPAQTLTIPADQADVMQSFNLTPQLKPGLTRLTLTDLSNAATAYQCRFQYHIPAPQIPPPAGPLSISVHYDRANLDVGQSLTAMATLRNNTTAALPMILVDLPIPAGFALETHDLDVLLAAGTIAKYQLTSRSAVVYLRELSPDKPLLLPYRLKANMAVKITVPAATIYEYYNPQNKGQSRSQTLRTQGS